MQHMSTQLLQRDSFCRSGARLEYSQSSDMQIHFFGLRNPCGARSTFLGWKINKPLARWDLQQIFIRDWLNSLRICRSAVPSPLHPLSIQTEGQSDGSFISERHHASCQSPSTPAQSNTTSQHWSFIIPRKRCRKQLGILGAKATAWRTPQTTHQEHELD